MMVMLGSIAVPTILQTSALTMLETADALPPQFPWLPPWPASADCPCGKTSLRRKPWAWADCCGRFVGPTGMGPGAVAAPDAECLMRSRYSAYVRGDVATLLGSWHPDTRPAALQCDPACVWLGLTVEGHWPLASDRAEVAFVARYRLDGRVLRLKERSRFVQTEGRWWYLDGR